LGCASVIQERWLAESIAAYRAALQVFEEIQATSYIETARRNPASAPKRACREAGEAGCGPEFAQFPEGEI
jgi:hypothetical protein